MLILPLPCGGGEGTRARCRAETVTPRPSQLKLAAILRQVPVINHGGAISHPGDCIRLGWRLLCYMARARERAGVSISRARVQFGACNLDPITSPDTRPLLPINA